MFELAIVLLVLGLIGAGILRQHLRDAKVMRLREIEHRERMAAMENGGTPPETTDSLRGMLGELGTGREGWDRHSGVVWIRLAALGLGLAGLFGGIGTTIGFSGVSDAEVRGMYSLGFIPVFIGLGLLLFYRMSRNLQEEALGRSEAGENG